MLITEQTPWTAFPRFPRRIFSKELEGEEMNEKENDEAEQKDHINYQSIKISYVNINGLNQQKIANSDMIKDANDSDIICFTETHLKEEDDFPVIDNFIGCHTIVRRNNYLGRNIKGISVYYKESIKDTQVETLVSENGSITILKISNKYWLEFKEIFLIICYKENRESKYKENAYFETVKKYMINFKMRNIILIGDLNGRIGLINDNKKLKLSPRNSQDSVTNNQGKEIITFCNETTLIIANGRLEKGNCTFHKIQKNNVKKSVIDYLIISESIIDNIKEFTIMEPVLYTDHSPMNFKVILQRKSEPSRDNRISNNLKNRISKDKSNYPYKWTPDTEIDFDNTIFKKYCRKLCEKLSKVELTNDEIYEEFIQNKNKAISKSQRSANLVIYSDISRKCRQKYKKLINIWKSNNSDENLRAMLKAKQELNKLLRTEKRKRKFMKLKELKQAKDNKDAKKYWQLINQNRKAKTINKVSRLSAEDFKTQIENRDAQMNPDVNTLDENMESKAKLKDESLDFEFSEIEIEKSLKTMQNNKSSGPDGFVYDILKENFLETKRILWKLYNNVLRNDSSPWNTSWIIPIYKNGNKDEISSYRCINLSSCIEKLLTKIMNNRLNCYLEINKVIHPSQIGFRKGNSVLDNILLLKELMTIYKNRKRPMYLCFIDLSKAFDSIPKNRLKNKLKTILPDTKLLSAITELIDDKVYKILYNGKESAPFKLQNGIPQGDSMSPTLFCLFMNDLFYELERNTPKTSPVYIENTGISAIAYADDILLLSETQSGLITQIKIVQRYCQDNGLRINYEKTKVMIQNTNTDFSHLKLSFKNENKSIEVVEEYKYLGMYICKNNKKHIENLQKKGKKSAYQTAKSLKEFGDINGRMLKDTFEVLTLSKMKYCGELCHNDDLQNLNRIQYQFYKRFFHLKTTTPNYCLIGEFGLKPMEFHFYKAAIMYWTKLITTDVSTLKSVYDHILMNIDSSCYKKTWTRQLKNLLYELNLGQLWVDQLNIVKYNYKSMIISRLNNYFREKWINSAKHSNKGRNYLELSRFDNDMKAYLNIISEDRNVLSLLKFRTGNHNLATEKVERYKHRKLYEECVCTFCNDDKVEDIHHLLCECSKYNGLRKSLIPFLDECSKSELFNILNQINKKQLKLITSFISQTHAFV